MRNVHRHLVNRQNVVLPLPTNVYLLAYFISLGA